MGRQGDAKLRGAAEGEARTRQDKSGVAEWRGFVNVELTAAEKGQFDDWVHTGEFWEVLEGVVVDGCVFGVKQDPSGVGYLASCTQRNPRSVNAGYCVTARAGSAGKALLRLLFVLVCLGSGEEWTRRGSVSDPDRW